MDETNCGNLLVRSLYASLTKGDKEPFLASTVWSLRALMKIGFFV